MSVGREGKNTGGWENGKNVSVTCRPQWAPQAEQRETEKKKLFPNLLRSEEKKKTKSSLVPSSHTKGARAHARRRFTAMYTLQRAAARAHTNTHTHTQESNGGSSNERRGSPNNITTITIIIHEVFSACRQNPGLEEEEEEQQQQQQDARTPLGCFGETPFLCPAHSNGRGERRKKKKRREQCTATASVVVPQPHLCCCPAYFFPPHCAVVGAGTRHTQHPHSMRAHAHI